MTNSRLFAAFLVAMSGSSLVIENANALAVASRAGQFAIALMSLLYTTSLARGQNRRRIHQEMQTRPPESGLAGCLC